MARAGVPSRLYHARVYHVVRAHTAAPARANSGTSQAAPEIRRGRTSRPKATSRDQHSPQALSRAVAPVLLSCVLLAQGVPAASAAPRSKLPPPIQSPDRCTLQALDKFAETRAVFSQEASSGMDEAFVDVRDCDFSSTDLSSKVFSGVLMRGANFSNSSFVGVEFARADARSARFENADFTDVNAYSASFDGANLENAQFENAILTGATFGRDPATGEWANLKGAHFEGALLASSDVGRMCENPTLESTTRKFELGCRSK